MKRIIPTPIAFLLVTFFAVLAATNIIVADQGGLIFNQRAQVASSVVYEAAQYEAESGALTAPMTAVNDANALGGVYVSSKVTDTGDVTIPITISKAGTYVVWGRVLAPAYSSDSFYVSVDGGAKDIWDTAEGLWSPKWQWTRVTGRSTNNNNPVQLNTTGRTFQLSAGVHNITFQGRDAQSTLDSIVVTNDLSFVPTDAQPVPEVKKVTLTVSTAGTGSGTISGGSINCGSTCSQTTTVGNTLSVSAVPATGSVFDGWSGACSGTALCTVVLGESVNVIANFTVLPTVSAPAPVTNPVVAVVTTDIPVTPITDTATTDTFLDTNPPSAPANLRASFIAKTSVSLAWDVPADNVGVTGYAVYRNGTKIKTVSTNQYLDISRKPGSTYTYKVTASDAADNVSPASANLTVTTIPASTLLFKIGDQVLVTSPTNVRSSAGTNKKFLGTQLAGSIGRVSTGPVWMNGYWWWNTNFDTGVDGWTVENYFTKYTPTPNMVDTSAPSVPTNLRADSVATNQINVMWNTSTDNVGVVGYKLYRNGSLVTTQAANSYADTGLQAGTSYVYAVSAYDAAGNTSALTNSVTGSTLAQPVAQTYTLTVSKSGTGSGTVTGGSINCGSTCTQTANSGTSITLTAVAAAGSTFIGWTGACSGTAACTVALTSDTSVAAQFDLAPVVVPSYPLTVTKSGAGSGTVAGGSINCGTTCSQTLDQNTTITLTATPASGSTFSGWSGACNGTGSCTVTMTSATAVTASFAVIPPSTYSLTVSTTGTGSGTVAGGSINCGTTCTQTSTSGTVVTLTATAASGSTFNGWSGACSGSSPTCNVTLTANASVTASFTQNVVVTPPAPTPSGVWYASPTGSSSGAGTLASPWDLKTALAGGNGKILAGHTLYLRGGTYTGLFTSTLTGTSASPIVVRSAPGEWAIIDGAPFTNDTQVALQVNGGYAWYRDFEVTNSNPNRPEQFPFRPAALNVYGANTKFINLFVHDGGQGIGFWSPAVNSEIYGSVVYNNGGEYRDHGIYTQNDSGTKLMSDNIIANNYGYGIHAYGSGTNGTYLMNYTMDNNTIVNNPSLIGNRAARNMSFRNNSLYNAAFNFGYTSNANQTGYIENNYIVSPLINYMGWKDLHVRNNFFWRNGEKAGALTNLTFYDGFAYSDVEFSNNTYFQFDPWESADWYLATPAGAKGYKFSTTSFGPPADGIWQSLGYDADSTGSKYIRSTTGQPTGKVTFVRPNKYEDGRALVTVYNWDLASSVDVSLNNVCYSSGVCLRAGDTFTLKNGLNMSESITVTADANNTITIPMSNKWTMAAPIGTASAITNRPTTFPEFGAFILIKK